jgi:uncharacterized membrane protein YqaE (UPF0057 family)
VEDKKERTGDFHKEMLLPLIQCVLSYTPSSLVACWPT